jgi:hypothetical protein
MEVPAKSTHVFAKIVGGLLALVVAPIVTTVASNYLQKWMEAPKNDASAGSPAALVAGPNAPEPDAAKEKAKDVLRPVLTTASTDGAGQEKTKDVPESAATGAAAAAAAAKTKEVPTSATTDAATEKAKELPRSALALSTASTSAATKPYGLNKDPENVFRVSVGELHVSGKVFGGLVTLGEYENYRLIVEYKWGQKKWPPREDRPRQSGIVLHASGSPGAIRGWSMVGITCMIGEDGAGSLQLPEMPPKPITFSAQAELVVLKKAGRTMLDYKPGGTLTMMKSGILHSLGYRPPLMAKAKAALGKAVREVGNPVGEWNTLECVCNGDTITVILNGTTVNHVTKVSQTRGKIFVQSQGAEIVFRKIDLRPLPASGHLAASKKKGLTVVRLFNGRDLTGFDTYLSAPR